MNQVQSYGKTALNFGVAAKNAGKEGIEFANKIVTNTDRLQKTTKVATAVFILLATVFRSFVPGSEGFVQTAMNISKATKTTQTVIGATNVIGRLFEFTDSEARAGITKTWQKAASRGFLTVGQTLDTVGFVSNVASLNLGFLAANVIGNLPVLNLVKGSFIVVSSGFGIWDNAKTLRSQAKAQGKLNAWKAISIEDVKAKYTAVEGTKTEKYKDFVKKIDDENKFVASLKDHKIEKYETRVNNSPVVNKKSWISIVADIAKIAIIVVGTIAMAFVLTASAFTLGMMALAVIVTSIGLAKALHSCYAPKPEKEPKFAIA